MKTKRNYLEEATIKEYKNYSKKGLKIRARPFLISELPKTPKNLLVVGMALGGPEEIDALNKFFPKYDLYGIDIVKSPLKQKLNAKLIQSDVSKLIFKNNFFSGIMCSAVMHEVYSYSFDGKTKVMKSFSEISRALTKGGILAIREFFVPNEEYVEVKLLSKEAKEFSKIFIKKFRNNFNKGSKQKYIIKNNSVYSTKKLLYELMLHFRASNSHFDSKKDFFNSKEIEEEYLPLSLTDYFEFGLENGLEIVKVEYIDFPKYYPIIEKHFRLIDGNGEKLKNKFGFIDIIFRKK